MKLLVILSVLVHISTAVFPGLPGYELFSGLTGGGSANADASASAGSTSSVGTGVAAGGGGFPGGNIAGTVLDVKIGLLTALKNIISPPVENNVDFDSFDNEDGAAAAAIGTDGNSASSLSGSSSYSGGVSETGQMYSSGSGYSNLGASGAQGISSSYGVPSVAGGSSGNANSGYVYERPPPRVYRRVYRRL